MSASRRPPRALARRTIALTTLLLLCDPSHAETAYVVDRLMAGIREGNKVTDKVVRVVPTGTALEVLRRDGDVARVRAQDGLEGWIDTGYLMDEPPATARMAALEDTLAETLQQLDTLRQPGRSSATTPTPTAGGSRRTWYLAGFLASALVGLGTGFVAGLSWHARRERQKLAGYRI